MAELNISQKTLSSVASLAISQDKPIVLDYWKASQTGGCFVGTKASGEQLLVKTEDEYTSPIAKICQSEKDSPEYIICTENSLYVVRSNIQSRNLS